MIDLYYWTTPNGHKITMFLEESGLAYQLKLINIGKGDQFAPELVYFSDCVLKNRQPEPSGEEGLQDVRIIQALYESAETGKAIPVPPFARSKRPTRDQKISRPGVRKPELVRVKSGSED